VVLQRFCLTPYETPWRWQQSAADSVANGGLEAIALLEHEPVFTLGPRASRDHLLVPEDELARRGAKVLQTDRGGDITFHGPGQLVAYPILDLRRHNLSPIEYVRALEEVMLVTLDRFGIEAGRCSGRAGVWAGDKKIGFVGVRVRRGITTHGFALNVDVDLSWFDAIVPCGLPGVNVTSMKQCIGLSPSMNEVTDTVARSFESVFGVNLTSLEREALHAG
jgi:lipoate-protein ligase B